MSTANANRPHQRWTRQLLRGSALLPRPSTLKLFSLPVASGASFRLALGPHPPPTMRSFFIGTGRGGVIAREIVASRVQAPPAFCTEAKVAKGGGRICGTLRYVIPAHSLNRRYIQWITVLSMILGLIYCRSGNFRVKNNSRAKFSCY